MKYISPKLKIVTSILIAFLFFSTNIVIAKSYINVKIEMHDGKQMQGYMDRVFTTIDKEIEFYKNKDDKSITIKSSEIKYLQLVGTNEDLKFFYTKVKVLSRKANSEKYRIRKISQWLNLIATCNDLSAYQSFLNVHVNRKGNVYLERHKINTEISLKRENENEVTLVDLSANIKFKHTHTFTNRGNIEKALKKYFASNPSVIKKVENEKHLGINFIESIVEDNCNN